MVRLLKQAAVVLLFAGMALLAGCGSSVVYIATPVPQQTPYGSTRYIDGVLLAEQQIAEMDLPARVVLIKADDSSQIAARRQADEWAADEKVIGVVGHLDPETCITLSPVYNQAGLPLLIPTVSQLTVDTGGMVFRNIPSDAMAAQVMCERATDDGFRRLVLFHQDNEACEKAANAVELQARESGLEVVDRVTTALSIRDMRGLHSRWEGSQYQAVFNIGSLADANELLAYLHPEGFGGRIYCCEMMTTWEPNAGQTLFSLAPGSAGGERMDAFVSLYTARFDREPDIWAMQAYDSIMLMVDAVDNHKVRTAGELAEYFRSAESLPSIFGDVRFDEQQELSGRPFYLRAGPELEPVDP